MTKSEITEVYSAADDAEAYFVKNLLEDAGIKAQVVNDQSWVAPGAGDSMAPRIWVSQADERRARELVLRWEDEHTPAADEDEWKDDWEDEEEEGNKSGLKVAAWKCPG